MCSARRAGRSVLGAAFLQRSWGLRFRPTHARRRGHEAASSTLLPTRALGGVWVKDRGHRSRSARARRGPSSPSRADPRGEEEGRGARRARRGSRQDEGRPRGRDGALDARAPGRGQGARRQDVLHAGKAAIKAALAASTAKPSNVERDKYRHPAETLEFFGFKPTMTVLEYGPGEGWYTELLAPALAKKGKLFVTNGDPNGPPTERSTFYGAALQAVPRARRPSCTARSRRSSSTARPPKLAHEARVDMVLLMRELHGMAEQRHARRRGSPSSTRRSSRAACSASSSTAPRPTRSREESAKKGYLPEKWVIEQIEAAGFKLAGKSEINANPKDTKDYADGVWTLPPTLRARRQGPREVRGHRRERSHDAQVREEVSAPHPQNFDGLRVRRGPTKTMFARRI